MKVIWLSKGGSSGANDGNSLMAIQNVLLDLRDEVDYMIRWVAMGW